jgi:hypothetical protein
MKPQRPQRKTLCPQKDLPNREVSEHPGAWKNVIVLSWGSIEGRGKEVKD